jgi:hypothetical protein
LDGSLTVPATSQQLGSAALAVGALLVAAVAAGRAALHGQRGRAVRFAIVAGLAGLLLWSAVRLPGGDRWPVPVGAALVVCATIPSSLVVAVVGWARRSRAAAGRALAGGARAARSAGSGVVHGLGRGWGGLLGFAAPPRTAARPVLARRDRVALVAMGGITVAFVGQGAWWAHRVGWQPTGHSATLMARAYDVGTANHPLSGMATSLGAGGGASHPGPLSIDAMAPMVRLFGVQQGALIGGVVVVLACWWLATWSAWRALGRGAAVAAWAFSALVIEIGALGIVWESNNITISTFAMFACLMASWAAATGTWRAWWWAVLLGSFCSQSYLPHGLIVLGPVLWSGLAIAGARRAMIDPAERRAARSALVGGWVIALVAWSQPVIDVVVNDGGNVRALFGQVADAAPSVGLGGLPRALAWIFSVPPRWTDVTGSFATAGTADELVRGSLVLGAIVAALVVVAAWRTRRSIGAAERQLRALTVCVIVGAGVNITRLPQDALRSFQIGWLVISSLCVWFAVGVGVGTAVERALVPAGRAGARSVLRGAGAALAVAVVVGAAVAAPDRIEDVKGAPFTIDAMIGPAVDEAVPRLDVHEPVLVLATDARLNEVATDTIASNLIVHGLDARTERYDAHYGERRIVDRWDGPMLWVTSGVAPIDPDGTELASASVPGWSRRRFDDLARTIARRARADGPVELQPWAMEGLPRYLAGWVEEPCRIADQIRDGSYPVADLPPGLLLTFYGDLAVVGPRLPRAEVEEASGLLGQAPLEVWAVETKGTIPAVSGQVVRDGSSCAPSAG